MNIKFEKSVLWVDSYPIAGYNYIWPIDFTSVFKVKFQGFIVPNMVDIDYMSKASLQHHDYASNTVFSLNVLFHKNMHTVNQHDYGFFLLWYEHYGSVEIGLKVAFSYWYQLWYPQLEEMVCIMDVPLGRTPTLLSDKVYSFKLFRIYEDIRKMPKFHYIYA